MEFTPPYSSVVSSSSTPTTTSSMTTSFTTFDRLSTTAETTLFGCISLALGKFLHSSSSRRRRRLSPTYPSDHHCQHLNEIDHSTLGGLMMKGSASASCLDDSNCDYTTTPNIVARLMGLDSIPETTGSPPVTTHIGKFVRSRSKSMSSCSPKDWRVVEEEDVATNETKIEEGRRRGTRSSFSLRETPGFFELEEDDDFLVLKFDNGRKSREKEVKISREYGAARRSRRSERDGRCRSMESFPRYLISSSYEQEGRTSLKIPQSSSPIMLVNQMTDRNTAGRNRRRRRRKKRRSEKWLVDVILENQSDDTENSSPVSVLDQSEFVSSDHEVITSAEDDKRKNHNLSPRRKLLSELWRMENSSPAEFNDAHAHSPEETISLLTPQGGTNAVGEKTESEQGLTTESAVTTGLTRKEYHKLQNADMLNGICRLAEIDLQQSPNCWVYSNKRLGNQTTTTTYWEDEIGRELSLQIADELINELLHESTGFV